MTSSSRRYVPLRAPARNIFSGLRFVTVRKVPVREVKSGTVVRYNGEWGVMEGRVLDRWEAGPIRLRQTDVVEVPARSPGGPLEKKE